MLYFGECLADLKMRLYRLLAAVLLVGGHSTIVSVPHSLLMGYTDQIIALSMNSVCILNTEHNHCQKF